ncbi:YHS domain-containing (seleno)protein [Aliiglaciecola lipolytica]|uniref:YHS domain-containing protein n=1 Tax=Aliiglaciecola lipolytica E3 TaxID=1127673 RepID=K6YFD5_9ALTE|nr:YHS domain-containing (seleno)protein [Aliiglaciecola lipolytica]GAC15318.1 hypothetical protein GLIP_2696 [Aliiglaciecola lipolytica E3]
MKHVRYFLFFLITLFTTGVYASDPIETGFFNNHAIYGYDTVAYFTQNKAVKGNKNITTKWRGAQWHFANEQHRDMFITDPEKYAPQYGGYCAFAMSEGRLVGIDEDAFSIIDGKLYLNYSNSIKREWLNNSAEFIQQADEQYPIVVDL